MHIQYRKDSAYPHVNYDPEYVNVDVSSYKKSVHIIMYLESGENDERLRWPMFGMTFTLEAPDKIKVATITVCTNCKGQNLNRVLGGVYREREIAFFFLWIQLMYTYRLNTIFAHKQTRS